jgi:hypothetical protein
LASGEDVYSAGMVGHKFGIMIADSMMQCSLDSRAGIPTDDYLAHLAEQRLPESSLRSSQPEILGGGVAEGD